MRAKPTPNKLSSEQRHEIRELYKQGMTACALAKRYGVTDPAIYAHVKGIKRVGPNKVTVDRMRRLRRRGMKTREIAERLGFVHHIVQMCTHDVTPHDAGPVRHTVLAGCLVCDSTIKVKFRKAGLDARRKEHGRIGVECPACGAWFKASDLVDEYEAMADLTRTKRTRTTDEDQARITCVKVMA